MFVWSCFMILTENSGMWLASEKFIPQLPVVEEKENRPLYRPFETSWHGRECHEIGCYGWWDFGLWVQFQTEQQSSQWKPKCCSELKNRKWHRRLHMMTLFIVFCDSQGFVHYDSGSRGQRVNQGFSLSILQCLREAVWKKQLELWQEHSCSQKTRIKFFHCHPTAFIPSRHLPVPRIES